MQRSKTICGQIALTIRHPSSLAAFESINRASSLSIPCNLMLGMTTYPRRVSLSRLSSSHRALLTNPLAAPEPYSPFSIHNSIPPRRPIPPLHPIEVGMHGRLLRTNPSRWIVYQERFQQIKTIIVQTIHKPFVLSPGPLWKTGLVIRKGGHARPVLLGGCAEDTEDLEDLVDFRVARKEGLAGAHLGEDATN